MKVLVVDDELPIRMWIASVLKKIKEPEISEVAIAGNGEEAIKIFNELKPEVVLADIEMPVMDGIALLKRIKEIEPQTLVIILTCHDDFSYAREAISKKAYDYILKTEITQKKLESLLLKIEKELYQQNVSVRWMELQAKQEYCFNRLLVDHDMKEHEIRNMFLENQIRLSNNALFAIAFHKDGFLNEKVKADAASIQDERVENLVFYPYKNNINIVIGNIEKVPSLLFQKNAQYEFAKKLSKRYQSQVGVSELYYHYNKIPDMILESVHALNLEFYDDLNMYQGNIGSSYAEGESELEKYREKIHEAVSEENIVRVAQRFEEIYAFLKKSPIYEIELLKQYFCSVITRILLKIYGQKTQQFTDRMEFYQNEVQKCGNLSEMKKIMEYVCGELEKVVFYEKPFYTQHIARAIEYMEQNYKTCSVTEVADFIGLNADYFSRLIKKETGITFSQYLTNIKMNRAIQLLQNSDFRVYEIAEEVGYANFSYFSKMFKKHYNITPFEFRNKVNRNME